MLSGRGRRLKLLIALALGLAPMFAAAAVQDAEWQLEAAIHREVVLGDLKGAMEAYQAILASPAKSKAVAARALFQLGQCQEKLGQRDAAYSFYQRVVTEYGDQAETAGQARAKLAAWDTVPAPRNLKFEEGVVGKVPPGWFVPALPKDADYLAELRRSGCRSGVGCAIVLVPANAPRPLSDLMQSFGAGAYRGKVVRLRAWLRLEATDPDDRAQMWISVDREHHRQGFYDNMDDRPLRSPEWTQCEIVGRIDPDAVFIDIGVMSIGRGRVWVDDVSFEVVEAR
jgi:tetratricopeptide (TPR) repeat protein